MALMAIRLSIEDQPNRASDPMANPRITVSEKIADPLDTAGLLESVIVLGGYVRLEGNYGHVDHGQIVNPR